MLLLLLFVAFVVAAILCCVSCCCLLQFWLFLVPLNSADYMIFIIIIIILILSPYFLQITAADIFFFTLAESVDIYLQCDNLEKFPKLSALKKRIASNPVVSGWLSERPKPEIVLDLTKDVSK